MPALRILSSSSASAIAMAIAISWLLAGLGAGAHAESAPAPPADAPPLRAFHVGNSLTYGVLSFPHASDILGGGDRRYVSGMQILWGAPLSAIIAKADAPSVSPGAFGPYPQAFATATWDVVTLQPSFALLEGPQGDVAMATRLARLALAHSPRAQLYIYEAWPSVGERAPAGTYARMWNRHYTPGCWDKALYSQDYCPLLVTALRRELVSGPPLRLIPVGHVLATLDARLHTAAIGPLTGVEALYRDGTHLTEAGTFVALCTWYAVLRQQDPADIPAGLIPAAIPPDLARAIVQAVWSTVRQEPLTGLPPAPVAGAPGPTAPRP